MWTLLDMNEKMSHYWIELNWIWQIKSDSLVSYPKKIWTFWTHVGCLHQPTRNQLKSQFHCVTFAFIWLCSLTLNVDFVCLTLFVWLCLFDFVCLTLFVWFCLFDFVYLTLLYMTLLWLTLFIWLFVFLVWLFVQSQRSHDARIWRIYQNWLTWIKKKAGL